VEKACGGTLFLDEIGDLSLASQVKLLRLLQEQEFSPVGSDRVRHSNIRVVTSTHQDLAELKSKGLFREDLYYRLITHHIHLPLLKDRPGDIKLLLDYFLEVESNELGRKRPTYHPEVITLLKTYDFPGNIREFRALVADALVKHTSRMLSSQTFKKYIRHEVPQTNDPEDQSQRLLSLNDLSFNPDALPGLREAIAKVTEKLISEAMTKTGGNQTVAARILGISQQSLSVKIQRLKTTSKRDYA
jgi:DNA-binding NtrC family response regulator